MDIQGIECVSKVLVLISSSLALMGILFKGANEFFLNTIRMEYNTIPGQKSVFSMVVTMAVGLIFVVDIVFLMIEIIVIINSKSNTVCLDADNILISIIFILFIGAFAYAHIFNAINFDKVRKSYIDEFEGRRECHIIMANKDISCRLFLDIGDYYLIFKKGKETYIRKTEVKEIICDNVKLTIKKDKKQVNDKVEEQKM